MSFRFVVDMSAYFHIQLSILDVTENLNLCTFYVEILKYKCIIIIRITDVAILKMGIADNFTNEK